MEETASFDICRARQHRNYTSLDFVGPVFVFDLEHRRKLWMEIFGINVEHASRTSDSSRMLGGCEKGVRKVTTVMSVNSLI